MVEDEFKLVTPVKANETLTDIQQGFVLSNMDTPVTFSVKGNMYAIFVEGNLRMHILSN